jgi:hypothetical protein
VRPGSGGQEVGLEERQQREAAAEALMRRGLGVERTGVGDEGRRQTERRSGRTPAARGRPTGPGGSEGGVLDRSGAARRRVLGEGGKPNAPAGRAARWRQADEALANLAPPPRTCANAPSTAHQWPAPSAKSDTLRSVPPLGPPPPLPLPSPSPQPPSPPRGCRLQGKEPVRSGAGQQARPLPAERDGRAAPPPAPRAPLAPAART